MRTSQVKQSQVNNSINDKPYFGKLLTRKANYAMLRTQFEKKPEEEAERRKNAMKNVVVFLLVLGLTVIMAPVSARASTKSEHLSKALTMLQPCERAIWR